MNIESAIFYFYCHYYVIFAKVTNERTTSKQKSPLVSRDI